MASSYTLDLTKGPITKKLLVFVLPILLSAILQNLYTIADRIVVGRFVSDAALAAVGATGSPIALLLNLVNGISIGVNVVCANLKGAQKFKTLDRCMHTVIVLSLICGVGMSLIGILLARPILLLMSTPAAVMDGAVLYMRLYFAGVPALLVYNFGAGIMRAFGDTKRPMYILTLTGLLNVSLNLVFVVVFHIGVAGVALATMAAQIVSAISVMCILFGKKGEYRLSVKKLLLHKDQSTNILRVGIPCGFNGIMFNIANVLLQSSINGFNSVAIVAGNTAANDVTNFNYLVIYAFNAGVVSFAGQCYGARDYKRIDKVAGTALLWCTVILIGMATGMTIFAREILGLFNADPTVINAGYFRTVLCVWTYMLYTPSEIYTACSRGMGHTTAPTIMNLLGVCLPRIIWILLIFPLWPIPEFLYLCLPISWAISASLQMLHYFHIRKKLH